MIEYMGIVGESYVVHAEDECWDEETINELMTYDIFYSPNSVRAIMVRDDICYIGHEDDGYITFDMKYGQLSNGFHIDWIEPLIELLKKTKMLYGEGRNEVLT